MRRLPPCAVREKTVDRRALDEPPVGQEQDLVAEAPRLAEVVRRHHDLGAARVDLAHDVLDLARRLGIEVRGRLVEEQHFGTQRPRAREREASAARRPRARARAVGERAQADGGERVRDARLALRAANAGEVQAHSGRSPRRAAQHHRPLEHHRLPARRAHRARPTRSVPRGGARSPWHKRMSTLLPAPFGAEDAVRGPRSISSDGARRARVAVAHDLGLAAAKRQPVGVSRSARSAQPR